MKRSRWHDLPLKTASLVYFDIETTGLRPDRGAQITEMAVADHKQVRFSWKRADHNALPLPAPLPRLLNLLRTDVVVGHNLHFDFRFVAYEANRFDHEGPQVHFIDTLGLARKLIPATNDHRLETLLRRFDLLPDGELHTAVVDARATRRLFWKLVDYGDLDTLADAGVKPLNWASF